MTQHAAGQLMQYEDGVWAILEKSPLAGRRAALFLDRDGVLTEEVGHLHRPQDVRLLPGAGQLVRRANVLDIPVVVVTNQAGVGRGIYDWDAFIDVTNVLDGLLAAEGATVSATFACPFHPEGVEPYRHDDHPARKPNPGMLVRAAQELEIDLLRSWLVGDHVNDILAARAAGLEGAVHVLTGHGREFRAAVLDIEAGALTILAAENPGEATRLIPLLREPITP